MSAARLDTVLVQRGLARSRTHAAKLIADARVTVAGRPARKPALAIEPETDIAVDLGDDWASRGAHKLISALDACGIDVAGRRALDAGASTGGFTDVLLRRGAARVAAVDVGEGQLIPWLAADPRVSVHDHVNIRDLVMDGRPEKWRPDSGLPPAGTRSAGGQLDGSAMDGRFATDRAARPAATDHGKAAEGDQAAAEYIGDRAPIQAPGARAEAGRGPAAAILSALGGAPQIVVADLSFVSLTLALPALANLADPAADLLPMVKPQFEVGKGRLGARGVVRDPALRAEAVMGVIDAAAALGWGLAAVVPSALPGPSGNVEYFVHLNRDAASGAERARAMTLRAVEDGPR